MNQPHDHLFKSTFRDKRIARDYMTHFLPATLTSQLDLNNLELASTSYVNSDLEEHFSDVVYTCTYGEASLTLALLFEHKSDPKGIIYLQLLSYMLGFWNQQADQSKGLQMIIPIVVYHGKQKWEQRSFYSHFLGLDDMLRPYIPQFVYLFTDLKDWSDEALMNLQAGLVRNVMLMLKHYRDERYTLRNIERLFIDAEAYVEDPSQKLHIRRFWIYLLETIELSEEEFRNLFDRLSTSIKDEAMTTYQQLIQKGKIEGKIEGNVEKENLVITNAFQKGLEISLIAELTGLSEEMVTKRIKELGLER